jgi:predicted phage terminase large subunit-like protein
MSVVNHHLVKIHALTGTGSSVSTIATIPDRSGGSSVTTVTSQLGTGKHLRSCDSLLNTYSVTLDGITAILPDGQAEVFDIQIERTENFIANGVVSHNTRWSKMDLTGQIIDHMTRNDDADEWEVVEFPAILNDKPLWPDFWPIEELLAKKAGMDPRYWQAQYMQEPTSEEGALIKREWWNVWEKEDPPKCEFTIMALDAAQETNNRADYNALTTWGVFYNEETSSHNIILLNAIKQRLEFPELKALVLEEYKEWEPDAFIVEKKSNGAALYQEMRRMGVPVGEFTPGRGQDKISRVNAVSTLFSGGIVWAPDRRWAREVIEECNDFPAGRNDDLVDSTTLALLRFRQGGFVKLPSDEPEPIQWFKSKRATARSYY